MRREKKTTEKREDKKRRAGLFKKKERGRPSDKKSIDRKNKDKKRPQICLSLSCNTIEQLKSEIEEYREYCQIVEWCVDKTDGSKDYTEEELHKVTELDKVITETEKDNLIDTIIVKTQGFVNGNIKEGDKNPVAIFKRLLGLYKDIDRDALRENMCYFLSAIMPVCDEYGINMCVHPDDPPFQVLGLPRIVTNEEDIAWFLNAVDNPHNGLTFCAGSLSAGAHNDTRELAKKFAGRTHFVHLRSTEAMPGGNFIESSHLSGRGHLIDLIRIFEKENPGLPMRVDHGRMMLGDENKGYNAGYSFHGRMLALAQVEGMMAVVDDEKQHKIEF